LSLKKQSKYPDDVWSVSEDPSSLCYVLCVSRIKDNGEKIQYYQKISREEFEGKPDTVSCIAWSMTNQLTEHCRRANQQDRHMPNHHGETDPGPRSPPEGWGRPDSINPFPSGRVPIKFFRCNKEVSEDYANDYPEPLDELRMAVALWLRK